MTQRLNLRCFPAPFVNPDWCSSAGGTLGAPTRVHIDGAEFVLAPWMRYVKHGGTSPQRDYAYDGNVVVVHVSEHADGPWHSLSQMVSATNRATGRPVFHDFSETPNPWKAKAGEATYVTIQARHAKDVEAAAQIERLTNWQLTGSPQTAAEASMRAHMDARVRAIHRSFGLVGRAPVHAYGPGDIFANAGLSPLPWPPTQATPPHKETPMPPTTSMCPLTLQLRGPKGALYTVGPMRVYRDEAGRVIQRVIRTRGPSGVRRISKGGLGTQVTTPPFAQIDRAEENALAPLVDALIRAETAPTERARKPKVVKSVMCKNVPDDPGAN